MFSETIIVLRLLLASLLGGVIGLERRMMEKPAGIRTNAIVCIASTLAASLGLMSVPSSAYGHVIAGIVTGVGFIGAGVIFRAEKGVQGLTTAANLWAVAIIGTAIGFGYYALALATTIIIEVVMVAGRRLEEKLELR